MNFSVTFFDLPAIVTLTLSKYSSMGVWDPNVETLILCLQTTLAFNFRTRSAVINELPQPLSYIPNSGIHSSSPCSFSALASAPNFSSTSAVIRTLPWDFVIPTFDTLIDRSEDGVLGAGDAGRKNGLPG
jgi:hypothetical protein